MGLNKIASIITDGLISGDIAPANISWLIVLIRTWVLWQIKRHTPHTILILWQVFEEIYRSTDFKICNDIHSQPPDWQDRRKAKFTFVHHMRKKDIYYVHSQSQESRASGTGKRRFNEARSTTSTYTTQYIQALQPIGELQRSTWRRNNLSVSIMSSVLPKVN